MTEIGILLPKAEEHVEMAVRAGSLEYDRVWLGELWGDNIVAKLTEIATRTDDVGLGSAIMNVYSRSPGVLAMSAGSLHTISNGRFVLGVGTSTETAVETLHSREFDRPVRRAHETIAVVKQLLTAESNVEYEGEVVSVSDVPPLGADVPVYHAALGPANRRVVARVADGWIPHNIPFPELPDAVEYIAEYAERAGRSIDDIEIAPYVPAAVSDDTQEARKAIAGHLAYYIGSGDGYRRAIGTRFPSEVEHVSTVWNEGRHDAAAAAITDEMIDELAVAGAPDDARDQLRELIARDVIDQVILMLPNNAPDLSRQTMEALAPTSL